MDDASAWRTVAADDTPSAELSVAVDTSVFQFGSDRASLRVEATTSAVGHRLRRDLAAVNLSAFDELRVWFKSSRPADGSPSTPFLWRLRLGGPAMAIGAAGNSWSRYVPASRASAWELARFSLADVPEALRAAVTRVQLELIDASLPMSCHLDSLIAVRAQMIADVESALIETLDRRVGSGASALRATIVNPDDAAAPPMPAFLVRPYDIVRADERTTETQTRGDFSDDGFRLLPISIAFDLYYDIDIRTPSRADRAEAIEFILRTFAPRGELAVNGVALTVEIVPIPRLPIDPDRGSGRTPLRLKIATWQQSGPPQPVRPAREILVQTNPLDPRR